MVPESPDDGVRRGEGPHPEVDELLVRLFERASRSPETLDRLRSLVWVTPALLGNLSLSTVLRRITETACELVSAPYGALGVIAPDGTSLEEFIHVGMDDSTVAAIGHLPEGKGLLGALIEDPRPIRLRDIREDPRSAGFPEGHPPMRGFLGVPIRVRDQVFGNLYLASLGEGEFSAEDEELIGALAATAGVAIENARLYEDAQRRQSWLAASAEITRKLLSPQEGGDLRLIGSRIAELAGADTVTVVLPSATNDQLRIEVAVGLGAARLTGMAYPRAGTLSEQVLTTGHPEVLLDASDLVATRQRVVHLSKVVPVGPTMALPLAGGQGVRGVLVVARAHAGRPFTDTEVEMATTFAAQASLALELADARRDAQRMALWEDRARIARDLHDHVIQQLFAAGMTLQGALAAIRDPAAAGLVNQVVDNIDDSIRQIRNSIFQLRPHAVAGGGLRLSVLAVVSDLTATLGHDPQLRFGGPVDTVAEGALAEDVTAVVRELLTNAAKHAAADRTGVEIAVSRELLRVRVTDDGAGIGESDRRSGLANLRQRAETRGGSFSVGPGDGGRGTRAVWEVPLP